MFLGNYKGGVGKTTSTISIAKNLSDLGKHVLLIDLDPQTSLSELLIRAYDNRLTLANLKPDECLNNVFDLEIKNIKQKLNLNIKFNLKRLIKNINNTNVSFIPTSLFYDDGSLGLDTLSMQMKPNIKYFSILGRFLSNIKNNYAQKFDFVLIDCPPTNNVLTESAFLASDNYLIPTVLDTISSNGIIHYIQTVTSVYEKYCKNSDNHLLYQHYFGNEPELIGIFYNLIRKQEKYKVEADNLITDLRGVNVQAYVFDAAIDNYVDIKRHVAANPFADFPNQNKNDYSPLTTELLSKLK